jgi:hypothetical protein
METVVVVSLVLLGLLLGLLVVYYFDPNWHRPMLVRIASWIDPRGDQPPFAELPGLPDATTLRKRTIYIRNRRKPSESRAAAAPCAVPISGR